MMTETGQSQTANKNQVGATNGSRAPPANGPPQGSVDTEVRLNLYYFKTIPGILKIVEWVIGILCIALSAPALISAAHWFLFVVVTCFLLTFVWICLHLFTITTVLTLRWNLIEMIYTLVATILYFIAMVVMLVYSSDYDRDKLYVLGGFGWARQGAYVAAGVFALFNTIVYAIETFFHFKEWKNSGSIS